MLWKTFSLVITLLASVSACKAAAEAAPDKGPVVLHVLAKPKITLEIEEVTDPVLLETIRSKDFADIQAKAGDAEWRVFQHRVCLLGSNPETKLVLASWVKGSRWGEAIDQAKVLSALQLPASSILLLLNTPGNSLELRKVSVLPGEHLVKVLPAYEWHQVNRSPREISPEIRGELSAAAPKTDPVIEMTIEAKVGQRTRVTSYFVDTRTFDPRMFKQEELPADPDNAEGARVK